MADFNISDEKLTELLSGLDDDIEVPEAAGKAWRAAIKREARRTRAQRTVKRFASLAAAVVVLIGCAFLFRNNGILNTGSTKEAENVYRFNSSSSPVVMLEADGEADNAASTSLESTQAQDTGTERMLTGTCEFGVTDIAEAKAGIMSALEGLDAYTESVTEERLSYSTVVRVKNEDADTFIEKLKQSYPDMKAELKSVSPDENVYSLDSRLNAAYDTVNTLKAQLASADTATATEIYAQLDKIYADIDSLESLSNAHTNDLKYAHITVTASVNAFWTRLGSAFNGFINGFGSDLAITVILLLPVAAIIAACVFAVVSKKRQ